MSQEQLIIIYPSVIGTLVIVFLVIYLYINKMLDTSKNDNAALKNSLEDESLQKHQLSRQLEQATEALHQVRVSEAEQQTELKLLNRHHAVLVETKNDLDFRIKETSSELNQYKQLLSATQAQLEAEQHKVEALQKSISHNQETLNNTQEILAREKEALAAIDKKAKGLEVTITETQKNISSIKQSYLELQNKFDVLQLEFTQLSSEHARLTTSLIERDISHKQKVEQLEENKRSLTKEFENLANKIFEEKGKTFTHTSKSSIDDLLKPFREQIEGFQKRVNEVHDASTKESTQLNAEIKKVLEIGLKMSGEAHNLTTALKGNSQQRGAWGEAQLQRTLEMSGLIADTHYESQSSFKDLDGKQKQTDYLIKLPDNKHIIIDSKISLVAYDKAISAESDHEYSLAMSEHGKAVKKHIDDLAAKDYTNLVGMRSPSFVLMFMAIEPAYIDALKNNKDLFSYGYDKGVVLVSHTTLIPILRTVANLWVMEQSNKEAREISDRAGEIYNNVCTLSERLQRLGNTLNTASKHYNDTVKSLVGQQGLHGKVERFTQLSSKVSKLLPELEPKHVDFETEKLGLIAEAIADGINDEAIDSSNQLANEESGETTAHS